MNEIEKESIGTEIDTNLLNELKSIPAFEKIKKENTVSVLFAFLKTLVLEEKIVLHILFKTPSPLSIRQIRKEYLIEASKIEVEKDKEVFSQFLSNFLKKYKIEDKKTMEVVVQIKEREYYYPVSNLVEVENLLKKFKEEETNKLISLFNKHFITKIPSYYKIRKILEYFESLKIVMKRELEGRQAESLWFLAPSFSKVCSTIISHLEKKVNPTSEEIFVHRCFLGETVPF